MKITDKNNIKAKIKRFAEENNIATGVCDCERIPVGCENELTDTPFTVRDVDRRLEPKLSLAGAKSAIVIGVGNNTAGDAPVDSALRGRISRQAAGTDYHTTVAGILEKLAGALAQDGVEFNYAIFVDKGDLNERSLAVKAGLGYIGKNRAVIAEKFGSFFNIGYMLTDLEIEPDGRYNGRCPESCGLCIAACPGGALAGGGFDYRKCVSYLTQKKGELTEDEIKTMGNWIYGCDICQEVCPANIAKNVSGVKFGSNAAPDDGGAYPLLEGLINMDDTEFKHRFGNSAVFWRGRKTIARNAAYAKRNVSDGVLELEGS